MQTRKDRILEILVQRGASSSSDVFGVLGSAGEEISLVTVKRTLSEMVGEGTVVSAGLGRAVTYSPSIRGRVLWDVDAAKYCAIDPDARYGLKEYTVDLFGKFPEEVFSSDEKNFLQSATREYERRSEGISETLAKKEWERLVIELSWKSSKIEGNTYTLLDTEKLLLENKRAEGHSKEEAQMILNHKEALTFIRESSKEFQNFSRMFLEEVHKRIVKDLDVSFGLRKKPVGVVGSIYRPLENGYHIQEAVRDLGECINRQRDPYAKALLAVSGVSYIQPFEDGNKRTARLMANALLLAYGLIPLSYRSVEEREYREATLVFYELNSLVALKKIFLKQYDFAARNYAIA